MGFYQDQILPYLVHLAMRDRNLVPARSRIVGAAEGRVLEIGIGSGLNLPLYTAAAERVIGLEPAPKLLAMARRAASRTSVPIELVEGSAEGLPLSDQSIDTIVTTWTLCTIPRALHALGEMRRVLKPTGRLLFVEHGRAPEPHVRWWQDHLQPIWKPVAGGCHLNRAIDELIESAGFRIERLDTGYMKGLKPMNFMYEGSARSR